MKREKSNFRRERIIKENLLSYIELTSDSGRNKDIVREYTNGATYKEITQKYNISTSRVEQIVANYIFHASKCKRGQ